MAIAMHSCASRDNDPSDMAEATKRFTMASAGSTSIRGTGARPGLKRSRSRTETGGRPPTTAARAATSSGTPDWASF
ncbi:hypothetical protein D3C72_914410 [compost metagenome]